MLARGLVLILLCGGLAAGLPAAAQGLSAGEMALSTQTASAAVRNHGDPALRLRVWYPAAGPEAEVRLGPPADPVFIAGRVAADAPFADDVRHPLVLLSHGFGGSARQMTWLGAALARAGFVAVAMDHPGTNGEDGVTAEGAYAPWERTGDITAALDLVLANPRIGPHVDRDRIGLAGFSLGGFTGLLEAGARTDFARFVAFCAGPRRDAICDPQQEYPLDFRRQAAVLSEPQMKPLADREAGDFRDGRIQAVFLIAPALVQALDAASLAHIRIPVDIVLGDADSVAPPGTNGEDAADQIHGVQITVLHGVGHYDFLSLCGPAGKRSAGALCADTVDRAATHAATIQEAVKFFDARLGQRAP